MFLIRRWAILPWTHGENARLHYLESIDVCIVGLGQSRVMQWRASVSAALLLLLGASGGFCSQIVGGVAEHLGARAFSKSWREHSHCLDFSVRGQSHLSLMNGRVVGEAESDPTPPPPELYSETIFHIERRANGNKKRKKTRFEFAGGRLAVFTYKLCCLCLFSTVVAVKFVFIILSITT